MLVFHSMNLITFSSKTILPYRQSQAPSSALIIQITVSISRIPNQIEELGVQRTVP